jgi:hypothetical protein
VTGGKPIAVLLQSISGVSAIDSLATFYDIYGGKREVLFFYFVPDATRDYHISILMSQMLSTGLPYDHPRRTSHSLPRGPSADWY